jgi:hypothetical protein
VAAILTTDELLVAQRPPTALFKTMAQQSSLVWSSPWQVAGLPGAGATPPAGAGALCDSLTVGALPLPTLTAGQDAYLSLLDLVLQGSGCVLLADRLVATSGLSGIVTTAQAVNTPALSSRYADNVGNMLALEWYAATGATNVSFTVSYTNQAGVAGQVASGTFANASVPAGRVVFVPLAAGDTGVRSVQSVTLGTSTGTAGNFGVTLYRQVALVGAGTSAVGVTKDFLALGLPKIANATTGGACLVPLVNNATTQQIITQGSYVVAVK